MTDEQTPDSPNPLKSIGLLGAGALAAAGLVIGAAGLAGAQDEEPTLEDPAPSEEADADVDTQADRRAAHEARHQALVDELVEDGTITQDQVGDWQAVRDALQDQRDSSRSERLEGIAGVLDITVEELETARESGQSLADIAGDNVDALVDYFTEESTSKINEAVADGVITQEQADERLDGLAERIQGRIENGGGFGGRGHGHRGHHGNRGQGPAADAAADTEVAASLT